MSQRGIVTYAGMAHTWMCDAMGHLNVRHYVAMFDDASFQILGRIAGKEDVDSGLGWADVHMEIDYKHETAVGTLVTVYSHVEKVGTSSLTYLHEMRGTLDDVLHAQMRTVTVRFDLQKRRKIELEDSVKQRAAALLSEGHK